MAMDMAMPLFVMVVIAAVIVLVGLVGLVLLIVGIAKKRTALWVCGLVAMVLAGLALLVGAPVAVFLCGFSPREVVGVRATPTTVEAELHEGGCSITHEDGQVTAHVEGIEIRVIEPGSGGSSTSSTSGPREARHEIEIGNVRIFVEKRDGRITLQVNGRDCGRIRPGDSVVISESRDVLVNDLRRGP